MDSYFKELNEIYKENKTNTETVFELDESRIKGLKINYFRLNFNNIRDRKNDY